MADPLRVSIPHRLGKDEAIRRLKVGLSGVAAKFPIVSIQEEIWSGDRLSFRVTALGQTASGTLDVAEQHVDLEVQLPWLLARFAQPVIGALQQRGKLLLEKK